MTIWGGKCLIGILKYKEVHTHVLRKKLICVQKGICVVSVPPRRIGCLIPYRDT